MTDEGKSLGEAPGARMPGSQTQVPGMPSGERGSAAGAGMEGARVNGTGPQEDAGPGGPPPSGDSEPPESRGGSGPVGSRGAHAAGGAAQGGRGEKAAKGRSFFKELLVLIVVAAFLTIVIKTYVLQVFFIPSGSMENTLQIGDRVLVNKLAFDFGRIHRGDIVVFSGDGSWNPGTPLPSRNFFARFVRGAEFGFGPDQYDYIKRVIGLPGDHVACCNAQGDITVNGVPLNEQSYLYPGNVPSEQRFSVTVPPGSLWVMGDHRNVSYDSRGHRGDPGGGAIPESAVVGRAFLVMWPPSQWRLLPVPATFDQPALNSPEARAQDPGASRGADAVPARNLRPSGSPGPLALGFAGAVPVTLLQRKLRMAARRPRRARRDAVRHDPVAAPAPPCARANPPARRRKPPESRMNRP